MLRAAATTESAANTARPVAAARIARSRWMGPRLRLEVYQGGGSSHRRTPVRERRAGRVCLRAEQDALSGGVYGSTDG